MLYVRRLTSLLKLILYGSKNSSSVMKDACLWCRTYCQLIIVVDIMFAKMIMTKKAACEIIPDTIRIMSSSEYSANMLMMIMVTFLE
jgi:hypothetical protein